GKDRQPARRGSTPAPGPGLLGLRPCIPDDGNNRRDGDERSNQDAPAPLAAGRWHKLCIGRRLSRRIGWHRFVVYISGEVDIVIVPVCSFWFHPTCNQVLSCASPGRLHWTCRRVPSAQGRLLLR